MSHRWPSTFLFCDGIQLFVLVNSPVHFQATEERQTRETENGGRQEIKRPKRFYLLFVFFFIMLVVFQSRSLCHTFLRCKVSEQISTVLLITRYRTNSLFISFFLVHLCSYILPCLSITFSALTLPDCQNEEKRK